LNGFHPTEVDVGKELDLCDCFKRSRILDQLLTDAVKNAEAKHLKPLLVCSRIRKPTVAWKRIEDFEGELPDTVIVYRGWVGFLLIP